MYVQGSQIPNKKLARPAEIESTVSRGLPAWGKGRFSTGKGRVWTILCANVVWYLFWLTGLIGICGVHRLYYGKWVTGLIWLFTIGIFGIGQLVDLFLIPRMNRRANRAINYYYGLPIAPAPGQVPMQMAAPAAAAYQPAAMQPAVLSPTGVYKSGGMASSPVQTYSQTVSKQEYFQPMQQQTGAQTGMASV